MLLGATIAPMMIPSSAHGLIVGIVCVAAPPITSTSGCPSSPATIIGSPTIGSRVVVAINIDGSDALNGFRIFVKTDITILNPVKADLNNTLLAQPILPLANCINGAGTGCSLSSGDGPGVVDVGAVSLAGLSTPPTTGNLFEIVYQVAGTTTGSTIGFLAGSCGTGTSVPGYCVTITNGGSTPNEETAQTGTFINLPTFTISASPTFVSVTVGGASGISTITVTPIVGFTSDVGLTLAFNSTSNNPSATLAPLTIPGASGTSTLTISATASNQAGGHNITITGTGGSPTQTRSVSVIVKVTANPVLTTSLSAPSIVVGTSISDSASLAQASTSAGGTVTYNLFSTPSCTGNSQPISSVSVTASSVPNSRSVVMNQTGTFSFNATYTGDFYNNPSTSPCEQFNVIKASPSISTTLSSTTINPLSTASDSASITGGFYGPPSGAPFSSIVGNVTYTLFAGPACTGTPSVISFVPVNGNTGSVPDSRPVQFNATGTWSWNATYSGDLNNDPAVNHTCEVLTVMVTQDFQITSSSNTVSVQVGNAATVTITVTSVQGFSSFVTITNSTSPPSGLGLVCNPNPLNVPANGAAMSTCTFTAFSTGTYTVTIRGTSTTPPLSRSMIQPITVTVSKATATISTQIFDATTNTAVLVVNGAAIITNGTTIYDHASVTGYAITGSVTYDYYTFGDCSGTPITKTVIISGGVVPNFASPDLPVSNTAGFFSIDAMYNGDGNNTSTPLTCEPLTVNVPAVAAFNLGTSAPFIVRQNLTFNATASFDPDALAPSFIDGIVSYSWDFGDGSSGSGSVVTHFYIATGDYTIVLIVADHYGVSARSASLTIHVDTLLVQLSVVTAANSTTIGKSVSVSADVKNSGTLGLTLTVTLDVNGKTVDQKTIDLPSGKDSGTFTLTWDTTSFTSGNYNVTVRIANAKTLGTAPVSVSIPASGESTQVALTAPSQAPTLPGGNTPWIILAAVVVIAVAAYLFLRRRRKIQTV